MIAGFSYISMAQQPQQPQHQHKDTPSIEERVNRAIKIISRRIELSDTEKEGIKNAFTDFYKKVDEVLQTGERPEKSVMNGYEKERDNKVKQVLSEEKYEDYLRITCELRPQRRENNKRHPDAGKPIN
jgi:hypothetical protein